MTRRRITRRGLLRRLAALPVGAALGVAPALAQAPRLRFVVRRDARGEFRWTLRAANGESVATSGEGFRTRAACFRSIEIIRQGAASATIVEPE